MYMMRWIALFLVILTVLVAYNPVAHEQVSGIWQIARPVVVEVMDGVYAAVRGVIAGNENDNHIDDTPVYPGVNFERIVTMIDGVSS